MGWDGLSYNTCVKISKIHEDVKKMSNLQNLSQTAGLGRYFTKNNTGWARVAEWYTALYPLSTAQTGMGSSPRPNPHTSVCWHIYKYVDWKGSAAMLTSLQSAGVTPEVNLSSNMQESMQKGIHLSFESQGRCHRKAKTGGISGPK